jgi:hypothetical protein
MPFSHAKMNAPLVEMALRAAVARYSASGSHTIEFWLAVLTGVSIVSTGWTCVVLRTINRLCRSAADPETRTTWARRAADGHSLPLGVRLAYGLWRRTNAGDWPHELLSLGEWIALGTLIGATGGFLAYFVQG